MIKFFRNIRQSLLQDGKTSKYFKYAIGEIILVVIGILIALQINNWNEQRKDNIKEAHLVRSLYHEFIDNYHYIDERRQHLKNTKEKCGLLLLKFCNLDHTDISSDSLLTLINNTFLSTTGYAAKTSTFERVIDNEEYNLIQHDSLKALLNQYKSILDLTNLTNNKLFDLEDDLWSYAHDKFGGISIGKKIDMPYIKPWFESIVTSEPSFSPEDIVSDIAFENILTNNLLYYGYAMNRMDELQELNQAIKNYIDRHYKI